MSHYAGHKKVAANTFQTCEKHLQLYPIRFPMSICLTLSLPLALSRQQKIIYKSRFSYNIQLSEMRASGVEQLFMVL